MFESGGSVQAGAETPGVLSGVPDDEWTSVLRGHHASIARMQFLEVDAVASVYLARCAEDARRGCNEAFAGEFAHVEVGGMLTVTEPVARRWIGLGLDLRWRLHGTSVAFASGRIDLARAQAISDALENVSAEKVELLERLLLDGIDGATTSMIRRSARRLVARHDPAGATARRKQGQADRDVRFRVNDDGTCSVEGTLPGPAGQVVAMRLRRMCFEVCARDPRTFAQRRADALVALADGSGRLRCLCGRADCAQKVASGDLREVVPSPTVSEAGDPEPVHSVPGESGCPAARTVDAGGGADASATSGAGGETVVGAVARETAAIAAIAADCETAAGAAVEETTVGGEAGETASGAASAVGGAWGGVGGDRADRDGANMPPLPPATVHVGVNLTTLLGLDDLPGYLAGHGWIDADLARDLAADGTWRKVLTLSEADREALLDALCGHPGGDGAPPGMPVSDETWLSGRRVDTLAHGTIVGVGRALAAAGITPSAIRERSKRTREQLTYRPSQRLAEIVRARDGICRFPGCTVRAVACDLDHTVPFDHADPTSGGWTVEQNLACLCRRHHRLKTLGRWKVRQIGGGRLEWTMPTGEVVVTEPSGEFSDTAVQPDEMSTLGGEATSSRDRSAGESTSDSAGEDVPPSDGVGPSTGDGASAVIALSDSEIAAALGVTLIDSAELARLFGQPRGRGVEADLRYLLECAPKPIAVVDRACNVKVYDLDRAGRIPEDDEPAPF